MLHFCLVYSYRILAANKGLGAVTNATKMPLLAGAMLTP